MGKVIRLTDARRIRGWNRSEFARRLVDASKDRGGPILGTGPDGVLRWEQGRTPDWLAQAVMTQVLGIDPALIDSHPWPGWLEYDPLQHHAEHPWTPRGAREAIIETVGSDMRSRAFLLGPVAITTALLAWHTAESAAPEQTEGRHIGEAGVATLERQVHDLRTLDDAERGGCLIHLANAALTLTVDVLSNRSGSIAHKRRTYAAAADLVRMKASATFDEYGYCDDVGFRAALQAAHAADDSQLGAHILAFWAAAAYNTGRAPEAVQLADSAVASVRGSAAPRVQALAYARSARARSENGDEQCWRDLERAETLIAAAESSDGEEPAWAFWFDASELRGARASCELAMGRYREAEASFAKEAARCRGRKMRSLALYLARQADAQLRQGRIDAACATAHSALDLTSVITSHRTMEPLRALSAAMSPYAAASDVQRLRKRIATVL